MGAGDWGRRSEVALFSKGGSVFIRESGESICRSLGRLGGWGVRRGVYRYYTVPVSRSAFKARTSNDGGRSCYLCYCGGKRFAGSYAVSRVVRLGLGCLSRFGGSSRMGCAVSRTHTAVGRFFPRLGE